MGLNDLPMLQRRTDGGVRHLWAELKGWLAEIYLEGVKECKMASQLCSVIVGGFNAERSGMGLK